MVFLPAEKSKFFIFAGTQLVQLGEEGYARFNVVIKVDELESHQDSPNIGIQLGNQKLVESKNVNKNGSMGYRRPAFSCSSKTIIVSSA